MRYLIIGMALAVMALPAPAMEYLDAKAAVVNGHTLIVNDDATGRRWTVHLWGIDAPGPNTAVGAGAKVGLALWLSNRKVACKQKERFQDLVFAVCVAQDNDGSLIDLSVLQLRGGSAKAWPRKDLDQKYRDAEAEAKRLKRGLWRDKSNDPPPVKPSDCIPPERFVMGGCTKGLGGILESMEKDRQRGRDASRRFHERKK